MNMFIYVSEFLQFLNMATVGGERKILPYTISWLNFLPTYDSLVVTIYSRFNLRIFGMICERMEESIG